MISVLTVFAQCEKKVGCDYASEVREWRLRGHRPRDDTNLAVDRRPVYKSHDHVSAPAKRSNVLQKVYHALFFGAKKQPKRLCP